MSNIDDAKAGMKMDARGQAMAAEGRQKRDEAILRAFAEDGLSMRAIGRELDVSEKTIRNIVEAHQRAERIVGRGK